MKFRFINTSLNIHFAGLEANERTNERARGTQVLIKFAVRLDSALCYYMLAKPSQAELSRVEPAHPSMHAWLFLGNSANYFFSQYLIHSLFFGTTNEWLSAISLIALLLMLLVCVLAFVGRLVCVTRKASKPKCSLVCKFACLLKFLSCLT